MSGSSLDGLDIAFVSFEKQGSQWQFEIVAADCIAYSNEWQQKLRKATALSAKEYLALHAAFGKLCGDVVNDFIKQHNLAHQVQLICSHGHTVFHHPESGFTAQLGDGATIAALTGINTVSDLRAMDIALGGQGAPIVPIGESLLFPATKAFLNLGGIANLSLHTTDAIIAYDICPANRVLNALVARLDLSYDNGGAMAKSGFVRDEVLAKLNALPYYSQPFPKSLDNGFGLNVVLPILQNANLSVQDALRTMVEHICIQISRNLLRLGNRFAMTAQNSPHQLMICGGGAFNTFLVQRLNELIAIGGWQVVVPEANIVNNKEALIMALLAVLRWREEATCLPETTGAARASIGGAVWIGQDA